MNKSISIYYKDLLTGETIKDKETHVYRSASMIKVPIMLCALKDLDLKKKVRIKEENKVEFSVTNERDVEYTYEELINWMIMISCNTSTNEIIDALGYDRINEFMKELGATDSTCERKMMDEEAPKKGLDNRTTAQDMALFLEEVLKDEKAMSIMKRGRHYDVLMRYISDDITVYKKGGSLDYILHDGGIFELENRKYLLVLMSSGYEEKEAGMLLGEKSLNVYEERYEDLC